ncbi:MAG TPA: hypothetical protein PK280_07200 [Planctomycetota bacterium]|nr:hypothetical protein [Planctomycetota bacterium]
MWNLIIGIVFIIGGLSGSLALRGTGSSLALAGLGLILCLWGGYQMISARSANKAGARRTILRSRSAATPGRKPPPRDPNAGRG